MGREKYCDFDDYIHRVGIITNFIVVAFFVLIPIAITIVFKPDLDPKLIFSSTMPIAVTFGIIGLCEKISMCPVIGPGAVYLASSTGNVQNMKLPAALNGMSILGCEEGSDKGKIVAIIAVASSAIVTTLIVFLGMLFLAPLIEPLLSNPVVKPAFDNMFPALIGAMVVPYIIKNPKESIVPFSVAAIVALIIGEKYITAQGLLLPVFIVISVISAKISFNKKQNKKETVK